MYNYVTRWKNNHYYVDVAIKQKKKKKELNEKKN